MPRIHNEKNTPKNFLYQKFDLKLAPVSPGVLNVCRVLSNTGSNQNNQRTEIYENMSRTLCMHSPSTKLEKQSTNGTYLLQTYTCMKYGTVKLSAMTYTFRCDNEKCKKTLICILTKYDNNDYFGRCEYCHSGRLKWIKNINLFGILKENKIIHKLKRP